MAFRRRLKFSRSACGEVPPDTRLPQAGHDLCAFQVQRATRSTPEESMPTVKLVASTILGAFEQAQTELVGKAVILTDGKAGTVENVWLDELHGLRISIRGHDGKWPISTIKFAQTKSSAPKRGLDGRTGVLVQLWPRR